MNGDEALHGGAIAPLESSEPIFRSSHFSPVKLPAFAVKSGTQTVIAVLDDDDSVRGAVVRVLRAAGFSARGFACGDEFLKSWHFDRPDHLLLDLQMPDMSGAEVQRAQTFPSSLSPRSARPAIKRKACASVRSPICVNRSMSPRSCER